jgi:hypothetical protein
VVTDGKPHPAIELVTVDATPRASALIVDRALDVP